jgi:hypothetical protein
LPAPLTALVISRKSVEFVKTGACFAQIFAHKQLKNKTSSMKFLVNSSALPQNRDKTRAEKRRQA